MRQELRSIQHSMQHSVLGLKEANATPLANLAADQQGRGSLPEGASGAPPANGSTGQLRGSPRVLRGGFF